MQQLKSLFSIVFILLMGLCIPFSGAFAQEEAKKSSKDKKQDRYADLGLTEDQLGKIRNLQMDFEKSVQPLKNEMREKTAKLKTAEMAARPDMTAIYKMIDDLALVHANIQKKEAATTQEIRKLLTDDQRAAYDTSQAKKGGKSSKGDKGSKGSKGDKENKKG